MWFKQAQFFELSSDFRISPQELDEKLKLLTFTPCLPSMPMSIGWTSPVEDEKLVRTIHGYLAFCLRCEEKILPANVIRQELNELIKQMESSQHRKLRQKEKYSLKDEVTAALLPRAFSRYTDIHAYLDTQNKRLVLGTTNAKKTEQFISLLGKSLNIEVHPYAVKSPAQVMTQWLKHQDYPKAFAIEKACVLQDAQQEKRMIRCKQQDLFAGSIQELIKDGCEVIQLALTWHDRIHFALAKDFSLSSMQFMDELREQVKEMEAETKQQQFDADLLIMGETLSGLINDLLSAHALSSSAKAA